MKAGAGMKHRSKLLWVLAFVLVAAAALYQRVTGPTWPVRGSTVVAGLEVKYRLPRSQEGARDAEIALALPDRSVGGYVRLRRTPSHDEWRREPLERRGDLLIARIPHQPPAGKVMYQIFLEAGADPVPLTREPVVMRYKGEVPLFVLLPHVILMFVAMLFSTRCGLEALARGPALGRLALWTVITLCAGGLILGPIVQKLAFGALWTGWPFGKDLTDNKTLAAALMWILALWRLRKRPENVGWPLAASIVLMAVYLIPHSLLGSELDYTSMPQS
jgi:hypothetical protein